MTKKSLLLVLILSIFFQQNSFCKDNSFLLQPNYGIYTGLNFNYHNPDFTIENTHSIFSQSTTSTGLHFGGVANYPFTSHFMGSMRLGIHSMSMNTSEIVEDPSNNINHYSMIDASLLYFEISPALQIYNIDYINLPQLYFLAGFEFGLPLAPSYDYRYEDQTQSPPIIINDLKDETLPDAETRIALNLGFGYTFPINNNLYISPEVSFRYPFNDVSDNSSFEPWNVPQLRLGVNLTFGYGDRKYKSNESDFQAGFQKIRYYDKLGHAHPLDTVYVEETHYTEAHPILPYIFFDKDSENISSLAHVLNPEKIEANTSSNNPLDTSYYMSSLSINELVLDIIGSRMEQNEEAKVTIKGFIDEVEEKNKKLSLDRANFVKNYLVVNYGIDPGRIHAIGAGKRPENASTSREEEGMEENRRVEIITNYDNILAPIIITSDKQRIATPDMIELRPYVVTQERIKNWFIEISQDDNILHLFAGKDSPEPVYWKIHPNQLNNDEEPIEYDLTVVLESEKEAHANGEIPVLYYSEYKKEMSFRPNKTIAKYSLVVFDFDRPEISDVDRELIDKYIIPSIEKSSIVQAIGYTDAIGSDQHNLRLSKERAVNVINYLKSKKNAAEYKAFGVGEKVNIFDNNTPVGRHLSRCVHIYVVTPLD